MTRTPPSRRTSDDPEREELSLWFTREEQEAFRATGKSVASVLEEALADYCLDRLSLKWPHFPRPGGYGKRTATASYLWMLTGAQAQIVRGLTKGEPAAAPMLIRQALAHSYRKRYDQEWPMPPQVQRPGVSEARSLAGKKGAEARRQRMRDKEQEENGLPAGQAVGGGGR